jgi:hypothetical protein
MDRRISYGTDARRTTLSPSDQARAEALAARYGQMVEVTRSPSGELLVVMTPKYGGTFRAWGENALSVVEQMCRDAVPGETL